MPTHIEFLAAGFREFLPAHEAGLTLTHNEHRVCYQTAAEQIAEWDYMHDGPDWQDDDAKARAAATDEIWVMRWYPHTPVGCQEVAAPTLAEVLALALAVQAG